MDKWITAVLYGFSSGAILFLVSLALSIGYGLMRVVNMEAMLYYSFGAYATYVIVSQTGSFVLGAIVAMAIGALLGLLVETQLLRRLYHRKMMFTMVATYSSFLVGIGIIQMVWGLQPKPVSSPTTAIVTILGANIPLYRILVIATAVVAYILIQTMLNKTIIGRAIQAGVENRANVQALGININKIFTGTFVVASAFAGLGGALNAPLIMVGPYMGFDMLLLAFITVIVGGLGSIKGTALSAILIGQVISVGGTIWGPLAYVAPFIAMFIVILVKPTGLMGVKSAAY
jgi:branched-subunit amino acid ABC-type transport system permease component